MNIRLLYFQSVRKETGLAAETVELPSDSKVSDLIIHLSQKYPTLGRIEPSLLIAVNQEQQGRAYPLGDGDEVALMPPFSGG